MQHHSETILSSWQYHFPLIFLFLTDLLPPPAWHPTSVSCGSVSRRSMLGAWRALMPSWGAPSTPARRNRCPRSNPCPAKERELLATNLLLVLNWFREVKPWSIPANCPYLIGTDPIKKQKKRAILPCVPVFATTKNLCSNVYRKTSSRAAYGHDPF